MVTKNMSILTIPDIWPAVAGADHVLVTLTFQTSSIAELGQSRLSETLSVQVVMDQFCNHVNMLKCLVLSIRSGY